MYTFGKQEHLCSNTLIGELYHAGHRLMLFPYSIHWMPVRQDALPDGSPLQVMVVTSKKKNHLAVDRNRIKRLTRECYRLHKPELHTFLHNNNIAIVLSLNYIHNSIMEYSTLYHKFDKLIPLLIEDISNKLLTNHETAVEQPL